MHPHVKPSKKDKRKRRDDDSDESDADDQDYTEEVLDSSENYPAAAAALSSRPPPRGARPVAGSRPAAGSRMVGASGPRFGKSLSTLGRSQNAFFEALVRKKTLEAIDAVLHLPLSGVCVELGLPTRKLSLTQLNLARGALLKCKQDDEKMEIEEVADVIAGVMFPTSKASKQLVQDLQGSGDEDDDDDDGAAAAAPKPSRKQRKKDHSAAAAASSSSSAAAAPLAPFPVSLSSSSAINNPLSEAVTQATKQEQRFRSELVPFLAAGMLVDISMARTGTPVICRIESIEQTSSGWLIKIADFSTNCYTPLSLSDIGQIRITSQVLHRFMSSDVVFNRRSNDGRPILLARGSRGDSTQIEEHGVMHFSQHCIFLDYPWPIFERPMDLRLVINANPEVDVPVLFSVQQQKIQLQRVSVDQPSFICAPAVLYSLAPPAAASSSSSAAAAHYPLSGGFAAAASSSSAAAAQPLSGGFLGGLDSSYAGQAHHLSGGLDSSYAGQALHDQLLNSPMLDLQRHDVAAIVNRSFTPTPPPMLPTHSPLRPSRRPASIIGGASPELGGNSSFLASFSALPPAAAAAGSPLRVRQRSMFGSPSLNLVAAAPVAPPAANPSQWDYLINMHPQTPVYSAAAAATPSQSMQPQQPAAAQSLTKKKKEMTPQREEALTFCAEFAARIQEQPRSIIKSVDSVRNYMHVDTSKITQNGWALVSLAGADHLCFWHIFRLAFLCHSAMAAHRDSSASDFIKVIKEHCLKIAERLLVWPHDRKWSPAHKQHEIVTSAVEQHVKEFTRQDNLEKEYPTAASLFAKYKEIVLHQAGGMAEACVLSCGAILPETAHYGELQVHSHNWGSSTLVTAAHPLTAPHSVLVASLDKSHFGLFTRSSNGGRHPFLIDQSENPVQLFTELLTRCV